MCYFCEQAALPSFPLSAAGRAEAAAARPRPRGSSPPRCAAAHANVPAGSRDAVGAAVPTPPVATGRARPRATG